MPPTITKDRQRYYHCELKYVGPSIAKAIVCIVTYECFVVDDMDLLVRWICGTYAGEIIRHNFKYLVLLSACFIEACFFDARESQQYLTLDGVTTTLGQKQLGAPDCLNKVTRQHAFKGKVEGIQINWSSWRYSRIESMVVKLFKIAHTWDATYVPTPINHRLLSAFKKKKKTFLCNFEYFSFFIAC